MSESTPVFVPIYALDEVLAERDRARNLAARLEAELAHGCQERHVPPNCIVLDLSYVGEDILRPWLTYEDATLPHQAAVAELARRAQIDSKWSIKVTGCCGPDGTCTDHDKRCPL